ncbi:MAG: hypothetical protein H6609_16720, partial [Ignavibacteriales bacterium]|nr:hypothetical protein [Ignavibacteriales bacterium]
MIISKKIKYRFRLFVILIHIIFLLPKIFNAQTSIQKTASTKINILPLGNSITYDSRINDTRNIGEQAGYRIHLYNLLKNAGYNFDFIGSEHSGGNFLPAGYDEHAGFPGISDDQLFMLLETGHLLQKSQGIDRYVTAGPYLNTYSPDVILLHVGTNDNDQPDGTSAADVEHILDQVDIYEQASGKNVIVLLARIIDRVPNQNYVNLFNNNIETMALDRVNNPSNDAYPDNIVMVDMQDSAGINYVISPDPNGTPGDMNDALHPNNNGYVKMASEWFKVLTSVLPKPPQIIVQPKDYYSVESSIATFSISAKSNIPVNFQWKKNGSNIPLAKDSTLVLSDLKLSDDNSIINCVLSNINGTIVSNSAKLFVSNKNEIVGNGLLAKYDFDEGEGNIIHNKIGNNNDLDLQISSGDSVNWITNGINISGTSEISTLNPVTAMNDSISVSNQFSIELWFHPTQLVQSEQTKIISISGNINEGNFSLSQISDSFSIRTRTNETNLNGLPAFNFQSPDSFNKPTNLILTRNKYGDENIYIDGKFIESTKISGDLSNWNNDYKFAIGNEFLEDIPWKGNIYYIAIYKRKLDIEEIEHNYSIGKERLTDLKSDSKNIPNNVEL